MTDKTVADLVGYTLEQQPAEFKSAFDEIMADKIAAALETKRVEVAANYFNDASEEEIEQEQEDDNNDTEEQDGQDSKTDA